MSDIDLISVAALSGLESALNAALALDPATGEKLAALEGRVIAIDIRGTGRMLFLVPTLDGLKLMGHFDGPADTTLSGAPFALFRMGSGKPGEGLFSGDVTISLYTVSGKYRATPVRGIFTPGSHTVTLKPILTGGTYLIKMQTTRGSLSQRIVVVR